MSIPRAFLYAGAMSAPRAARPVLELVDIHKHFGPVHALRGAGLTACAGEIVGVCGDNGAGKSTLVDVIAGVHAHGSYTGDIVLDGAVQRFGSPHDARAAGIAVVHEQPTLVPQLSVAHNLMLGREPRRFGLVDEAALEARAGALLVDFGLADRVATSTLVRDLGTGLRQIVEIVRALSRDARVIVLDEPARGLLPAERDLLCSWLRGLHRPDAAVIYIAHRMDELIGLCDRIAVVRDGTTAETLSGPPHPRAGRNGRYVVRDEIAAGGMATVHLGRIRGPFGFSATVAIKRLHPLLARDPAFVTMFLDEARLASRVRHANVVPVLDVFAEGGELCLVMEYVDGESLAQLCAASGTAGAEVPVPIAMAIATSILHGLHAAHESRDEAGNVLGLVHRDVSPQNVIVGADGVVRLIDFGIAKAAGRHTASRTRQLKGKIAYMAPEQIRRGDVTRRTDVYGAAVLLWELLVGERLFEGDTEGDILARVLDEEVPPPSSLRAGLSPAVDAIVLRGLDRAPGRRFDTALAMAQALADVVRPAPLDQVSDWVMSLAAEAIFARRAKLSLLEREALSGEFPDSP